MSVCRPATHQLIRNLVTPDKPSSHSFEELVDLVRNHYNPKLSAIVSRFKFSFCVRRQDETVATFVARLRQHMKYCNYSAALDEMLHDWLMGGINNESLQRRLLVEPDLAFHKAYDLALAFELAAKNSKDLQAAVAPADVHVVHKSKQCGIASCAGWFHFCPLFCLVWQALTMWPFFPQA